MGVVAKDQEKGFWAVERRGQDGEGGQGKGKGRKGPPQLGQGMDYWVLSIPQDEDHEVIVSYEVSLCVVCASDLVGDVVCVGGVSRMYGRVCEVPLSC